MLDLNDGKSWRDIYQEEIVFQVIKKPCSVEYYDSEKLERISWYRVSEPESCRIIQHFNFLSISITLLLLPLWFFT